LARLNPDQHLLDRLSEPVPQGSRFARSLFDLYLELHLPLVQSRPKTCFSSVENLGRVANRLGFIGPKPEEVAALFGRITGKAARAIAMKITGLSFKNELLMQMVIKNGLKTAEPFVRGDGVRQIVQLAERKKGAIFLFSHTGPLEGTTAGFHKAGVPVLLVRAGKAPYRMRSEMEECAINPASPGGHAFVLKKALEALKDGRFVLIAFDATYGGSIVDNIIFMGRRFRFRRGLAMLVRLTGAPAIPVSATWIPGRSDFTFDVHPPLAVPENDNKQVHDTIITTEAANWLESRIRRNPGQLQWHLLRQILRDG
jgi:lauroyl/myristoyl acyltransferase